MEQVKYMLLSVFPTFLKDHALSPASPILDNYHKLKTNFQILGGVSFTTFRSTLF